jgi:transcriptional regulator with XRE-family HTH domain
MPSPQKATSSEKLAQRIRQSRRDANLTQKQAAEKIGIAQSTWANVEHGNMCVSQDTLHRICQVVGLPLEAGPDQLHEVPDSSAFSVCINPKCPSVLLIRFSWSKEFRFLPGRLPRGARFCPYCGKEAITRCRVQGCGEPLTASPASHCTSCGQPWITPNAENIQLRAEQNISNLDQYSDLIRRASAGIDRQSQSEKGAEDDDAS